MATNREAARRIERDERAKARAEIAAAVAEYRKARSAIVSHNRQTTAQRKAERVRVNREVKALRRKLRSAPRELLTSLRDERARFRAWWAEVLAERQRRLAEIASMREHLAELRRATPRLVREAVEARRVEAIWDKYTAEQDANATGSKLSHASRRAKLVVKGTRGGHRLGSGILAKRPKRSRQDAARATKETRSEYVDAVASNLEPSVERWYRRHLKLFPGPSSGLTPDEVAERVVESLEAEPEALLDDAQARADNWLHDELEKAGLL
jgi:hypothetical protein